MTEIIRVRKYIVFIKKKQDESDFFIRLMYRYRFG